MLNYTGHLLILAFTGCVSISAFASLVSIPVGIASSATTIEIFAINAGTKKYKSISKKKKKKYGKTVFLAKATLNTIEVLTSKALIDSIINHDICVAK